MQKLLYLSILALTISISTANTRSFQFEYEVELSPTHGKKLELWIPVPQSNEVQNISNLRYDTNGLEYIIKNETVHNNRYLYIYSIHGINKAKSISMTFDVTRKEHSNYELYENVNPNEYLGAYSTVPIGNIFKSIIDKNNLTNTNMKGVYEFVLSGMHYGKPKEIGDQYHSNPWLEEGKTYGMKAVSRDEVVDLYQTSKKTNNNYTFGNGNSIYACDIGVGNCTDYHSYFMSLGRTLNVPVRFHMGFPIPSGNEGVVKGYHCWADYFVEDKGWLPVDISEADKDPKLKDYFFGTIDNSRVDMMIGRDFILEGYDNGKLNLFIYPILEIDDEVSSSFTKKFSYKDLE